MKILILSVAMALVGCAPTSSIVVGNKRPAINPSQVKLYLRPPQKYEEIALLETSSKSSWAPSDQDKTNVVIERLKLEAAKMGANDILLQNTGNQSAGSISTGTTTAGANGNTIKGYNSGIATNIFHKAGSGLAIFVTEE
jgi:hypothetical protein